MREQADVVTGTSIHLPMMVAAEEARDRCLAAEAAGHDVLTDAMVAVLLAAVAVEAAENRGRIAHYPGKDRSTLSTPLKRNQGRTETRADFTPALAVASVKTAIEALHAIGVYWAEAGVASGAATAPDPTVDTTNRV